MGGKEGENGKEGDSQECGEIFLPLELWSAIWTAKRRSFQLKF